MRGLMEADVMLAVFLFLSAYMAILISLPPVSVLSKKSADPLLGSAAYLSDTLVRSAGEPKDWKNLSSATSLGLAAYDHSVLYNILDMDKLNAINGTDCSGLYPKVAVPLDFRISVIVQGTEYACVNPFPGGAVVERLAYAQVGLEYRPAIVRVYARSVRL